MAMMLRITAAKLYSNSVLFRENIKILHCVESGSRAWGFPSPDSDYDVRKSRDMYQQIHRG